MNPWEWLARKVTKEVEKDISQVCSLEAVEKVDRQFWCDKVMDEYKKGPATADEVAYALGADILTIRPRVTELKKWGLLVTTGLRRTNDRGNKCAVLAYYAEV